ncbi:unnamed protein product [Knipowitschia caucasica]
MCEGPSSISGPIPPDPSLLPEVYKRRPSSARGRIEGNPCGGLLSGPLAPDPLLYPGFYSARAPAQQPRIGPNGAHILERGKRGVVGELLKFNEAAFISVPKQRHHQDFGKENVRRLREIQKRYREQQAETAQTCHSPVKAFSSKYLHVPSKVKAQLQVPPSPIKPQCQNFLKAHGALQASTKVLQRSNSCNFTNDNNPQFLVQGQTVNFIRHNAKSAGKTAMRRSQSMSSLNEKPVPSAVKGQVPQYIEDRKEQWKREAEERKRNAPDPSAPAGHTLMPESERLDTLKSLKESHRLLVLELLSLPLKADGLSVQTRKAHLDCRLSELEEAIKIFSRDKVYVKNNS